MELGRRVNGWSGSGDGECGLFEGTRVQRGSQVEVRDICFRVVNAGTCLSGSCITVPILSPVKTQVVHFPSLLSSSDASNSAWPSSFSGVEA